MTTFTTPSLSMLSDSQSRSDMQFSPLWYTRGGQGPLGIGVRAPFQSLRVCSSLSSNPGSLSTFSSSFIRSRDPGPPPSWL